MENSDSDSNPSEFEEGATSVTNSLLPSKSKMLYENAFSRFDQWCVEKKVKNINEKVLLVYFEWKSTTMKSSTLWTHYSMLRTMLSVQKNMDISKYLNLIAFLKRKSEGYTAKKSKVFTKEISKSFLWMQMIINF